MNYIRPDTLENALFLLADEPWKILSGGTDFYPAFGERAVSGSILDISALPSLRDINEDADYWRIGALATWSDLIAAQLPPAFDGLKLAAREVGSVQIQNRASVVGNVCNASPAADGVPPLLTLDCLVLLASLNGARELPISQFVLGNRVTALESDEMVTALLIPKKSAAGYASFRKLGARKYLVISIAMAAARLACDKKGRITDAAISVGACSVVAQRLPALENILLGQDIRDDLTDMVAMDHLAGFSPIDDIRAPSEYRLTAALEQVKSVIEAAVSGDRA